MEAAGATAANAAPLASSKSLSLRRDSCSRLSSGTTFFGRKPCRRTKYGNKLSSKENPRSAPVSASLGGLLGGIFKGTDTGEGTRKKYADVLALVNRLEPEMKRMSDAELRDRTSVLKERARNGESSDSLLPVCAVPHFHHFNKTLNSRKEFCFIKGD